MPIKAIPKISIARNGIGSYIKPCHKITIQYCNWGGSSNNLRQLLTNGNLSSYMKQNSDIFFEIKKITDGKHPSLVFNYTNGVKKIVEIKKLSQEEIIKKLDEYSSRSGNELFKFNHKVQSINDSVRGIWSPLHVPKGYRHKI